MVWGLFPVDHLSGEDKYYIFSKGDYKIGRKGCAVIINKDKCVSRIHAEVTFDTTALSSNVRIKDRSKYGTFVRTILGTTDKVHEFPNKESVLRDGDVITFGTGAATYRLSFIQLVFFFCDRPLRVDHLVKGEVSSFGARVAPTLSEECTHVLVESRMQVNEDLINAILMKKPVLLASWLKLVGEKSIRTEIPGYSQNLPLVMVEEALVEVADPKAREKCLEGYTFVVLEQTHKYKFGCSFPPLLRICGAVTMSVEEISSNPQDSGYGEINRIICVIPKSSGDKLDGFRKLSLLSTVNEMDLICAVVSGNLDSSALLPPAVVISSSCSTDETVVADTDTEEETSHVHMFSATEQVLNPEQVNESSMKHESSATKLGENNATRLEDSVSTMRTKQDGLNELKSLSLNKANTESRGDTTGNPSDNIGDLIIRRERNDERECGNLDIIYSQDLIVRDLQSMRTVSSAADGEILVVNFKRFRKAKSIPSGNSFSSLIPFSKYPYKEYENREITEYMKEEKKRKQMEAIAEDLFNSEKVRKRGMAGSLCGFLARG